MDKWNRAAARWKAIVDPLVQWPGLMVFTARGAEVTAMDENGRPIAGTKVYKVQAHKTLLFGARPAQAARRGQQPLPHPAAVRHAEARRSDGRP